MNEDRHLSVLDERITSRFPQAIRTRDGAELTVTPLVPSDWPFLESFLRGIPQDEQNYLRHDIREPGLVERWCATLDYNHVLPALAWKGDRIVADGVLYREPGLWTAHVGKMRLVVDPEFRGQGIGREMTQLLIQLARDLGLHKVVTECAAEQETLKAFMKHLGFEEVARLPEFVRDRQGRFHDMAVLVYSLR